MLAFSLTRELKIRGDCHWGLMMYRSGAVELIIDDIDCAIHMSRYCYGSDAVPLLARCPHSTRIQEAQQHEDHDRGKLRGVVCKGLRLSKASSSGALSMVPRSSLKSSPIGPCKFLEFYAVVVCTPGKVLGVDIELLDRSGGHDYDLRTSPRCE